MKWISQLVGYFEKQILKLETQAALFPWVRKPGPLPGASGVLSESRSEHQTPEYEEASRSEHETPKQEAAATWNYQG